MKQIFRCVVLICLAGNHLARSQSLFGTIQGTVTDKSQGAVAAARVTIRNEGTNAERAVVTDSLGNYEAPTLPVGTYQVTCQSPGFKRALVRAVVLQVDQRQRVDITLELGEQLQTVEISATARLIETETATQGTVIDNHSVINLPLNGRNFQQLAALGPGVHAPVAGSAAYFSVAGTRSLGVSFLMDGTTNSNTNANTAMINPSIDLIQEFKVLRNTFNAEFGHGAAQVNVVTRSGTNELHLTLFEFLRNDKLQARNFFDQAQKPALRRNQYGGTVAGPVVLPKLYAGRNRTFFLFNYEGIRQRDPSTIRATVPTQAELNGDLSGTAVAIVDPLGGAPFARNQIPASRFNSASRNFRPFIPVTDAPRGTFGAGLNYLTAGSGRVDSDQFTARLDHSFSSNSNGFARYTMTDNRNAALTLLPVYGVSSFSRQQSAVAGHNFVIRPNLINEFRAGFARHNLQNLPNAAVLSDQKYAEAIGLKNLLSLSIPSANAPPTINVTGYGGYGGGALITQRVNTFSYVDNLSWIHGKHSLKFGADIRRLLHDTRNIGPTQGSFGFTGAFSRAAMADFLLGYAQTATGTAPPGVDGVNLSTLWQVFAQDDWKATPNLTLSFGLRYEYYGPWVNNRNRISRFDPDFAGGRVIYPADAAYFVPGRGLIQTDRPLAPKGLYDPDRNDLGPRFGFAWRPFGSNRNSVRGSYGIFADNANETNNIFSIANPPHLVSYSVTNDLQAPRLIPWSELFPPPDAVALSLGVSNVNTVAAKMPSGYVQQWSFNLQRELTGNLALEIGYMGNKGTALDKRRYLNQAVLDPPGRRTSIASRLPYPAFAAGLLASTRTGMSHYNGFISRLERRFSNGFSFLAAYTFSKTIDNCSFSGNIGGAAQAQNAYDEGSEKALSHYDVPHRVVVSYIYELPFGRGKRFLNRGGAAEYLFGGWKVSGITQYQTGNPWPILTAGDIANVGTGQQRADLVGDPFPEGFVRGGSDRFAFNRAAFANPRAGAFGNSGRNIIRDASIANTDLNIGKDIPVTERMRLEFRAEFYNAWNHTQFLQFASTLAGATYGSWNSARAPRIIQFGLKLNY